jgi:hypothetical protein
MDVLENCGLYEVACLVHHIFSTLWIISIHGEPLSFFHSISSEVIILCNLNWCLIHMKCYTCMLTADEDSTNNEYKEYRQVGSGQRN